jgi:hypothetical protein
MKMFFISSGIMGLLYNRLITRNRSIQLSNVANVLKMNLLCSENLIIVLVSNLTYFPKENILGIELYDNVNNYPFILDKSKWSLVENFQIENEKNEIFGSKSLIKEGSVLILKEFSFTNVDIKDNKENNLPEGEEYFLEDILIRIDFFIIGEELNFEYVENKVKILHD